VLVYDHQYIRGQWVDPGSKAFIEVFDSTNGTVFGRVPKGDVRDIDAAVESARAAFPGWSSTSRETRAAVLREIAGRLATRVDELTDVITRETGMPVSQSRPIQAEYPAHAFSVAADVLLDYEVDTLTPDGSLITREAAGVVGCITPWNYPLGQIAVKVAYALAAGCTVVLKPSEVAPLDAFLLAETIDESSLPHGAFNLVSGMEALAAHPDVDVVSFTGSTRAGKRVAEVAANTVKRVALELGGKSANIILDDLAPETFDHAIQAGVRDAFKNSGQACDALTRMLVPAQLLGRAEEVARSTVRDLVVGDPFDPATDLGPLASEAQQNRVAEYVAIGVAEGAKVVAGGASDLRREGYYVEPTVFSNVTTSMRIAQEEIFGPVLCMLPYEDEEEAVQIANDSIYGLSGAVWSGNVDRAIAVARRIRTGGLSINGVAFTATAPFGGYKQSGIGRELGEPGLEEFLEVKTIQLPTEGER